MLASKTQGCTLEEEVGWFEQHQPGRVAVETASTHAWVVMMMVTVMMKGPSEGYTPGYMIPLSTLVTNRLCLTTLPQR